MPLMVSLETGEERPWPTGHPKLVASDVQELKVQGFTPCEIVVNTATGCEKPVSVEEHVQNGRAAELLLARKRADKRPAFLLRSDWQALSDAERDEYQHKPAQRPQPPAAKVK